MRKPRITIGGMMIAVAIVAMILGLLIRTPWLIAIVIFLVLMMGPQIVVVAFCLLLATRDGAGRS
jgi:hypothetical protein